MQGNGWQMQARTTRQEDKGGGCRRECLRKNGKAMRVDGIAIPRSTSQPRDAAIGTGITPQSRERQTRVFQHLRHVRPLLTSGDGLVKASFDARSREVSQEKHADFCARLVSLGCQSVKSETRR